MPSHVAPELVNHDPALAAARVVEGAVELARAEVKLVFERARAELFRAVAAMLAGIVAASAAQMALLLYALSPVLLVASSRSALVLALLPSLGVCAFAALLAVLAWRSLRNPYVAATATK